MLHERLWKQNNDLAQASLGHPFVEALRDGTLAPEVFRDYIAQDAFFLEAFARAYALALARSRGSEPIGLFHRLIGGVRDELKLHAAYAAELKIDLSEVQPNPACRTYTDFLLATAWHGSLGEVLAALTPCMRLYAFLGKELLLQIGDEGKVTVHPYGRWITTYSGPDMQELADHIDSLLDRFSSDTPAVRQAYRYAMQCEVDFFSAAWETRAQISGGHP